MTVLHKIYIGALSLIIFLVFGFIMYDGFSFYSVHIDERFYHPDYVELKPSGIYGHGYGIAGSLFMIIGVAIYALRKRLRLMSRWGFLKHWLEFHIFLCTLGPILVLFHTSFKFGGLVAISFWSMVAVFLSGIIGRFIYLQIPRSIEGRELSLNEIRSMKSDLASEISNIHHLDKEAADMINSAIRKNEGRQSENIFLSFLSNYLEDLKVKSKVKNHLKKLDVPGNEQKKLLKIIDDDISLSRRIGRLNTMQNLFKYWHVAHLPFALVMLIIMLIHITVTIIFGYRWIF